MLFNHSCFAAVPAALSRQCHRDVNGAGDDCPAYTPDYPTQIELYPETISASLVTTKSKVIDESWV
jgi:hypothetical protein